MTNKQIGLLIKLINYRISYLLLLDSMSNEQEIELKELGDVFVALMRTLPDGK